MIGILKKDFNSIFEKLLYLSFILIIIFSLFLFLTSKEFTNKTFQDHLFNGMVTEIENLYRQKNIYDFPNKDIFTQSFNIITTPIMAIIFVLISIFLLRERLLLFLPFGLIGGLTLLLTSTRYTELPFDEIIKYWLFFLVFASIYLSYKKFFKTFIPDKLKNWLFVPQLSIILFFITGVYLFIVFYLLGFFSWLFLYLSFPYARYLMNVSDPNKILVIGVYNKQKNEYKITKPNLKSIINSDEDSIILEPKN